MSTQIDPDAMGVEMSWSFGNGDAEAVTMPRETFIDILAEHGFEFRMGWRGDNRSYLDAVDADDALRRAARAVKGRSKEIVIQELRRPNKDTPRAFGVYRVIGKDGEAGDVVTMGARIRVQGESVVCRPPEGELTFDDSMCQNIGEEIARIANSLIDNVVNRDISLCLTAIGWDELVWVSRRRNSGGVYFAATCDVVERFVAMLQVLASWTHAYCGDDVHRYFVPQVMEVYPKPLALDMWKGAARDQFTAHTEQMVTKLQAMRDKGTMRDKTIEAHAAECDRLMEHAYKHRALLEDQVEEIHTALIALREDFLDALDENADAAAGAFDDIAVQAPPRRRRRLKAAPTPTTGPVDMDDISADELFNLD